MLSSLKYIFLNIEKLYADNQALLLDDTYRPCKSVPRDIFSAFGKFKQFYLQNQKDTITMNQIIHDVLLLKRQDDTVNTNIRVMTEFGFLHFNEEKFIFTNKWKNYLNDNKSNKDFITDELKKCKTLSDFNIVLNSVLCTLREGYYFGEIISFPDSIESFKQIVGNKETRLEFCQRVYQIYGFHGRNKDVDSDEYTPNANYRVLSILRNIGFIEQCESNHNMTTYNLTEEAVNFLKEYNELLGDKKMPETKIRKPFEPLNYTPAEVKTKSYNRIIFGAPGTGKSYQLKNDTELMKNNGTTYPKETRKEDRKDLAFSDETIERVTFHPDYSYGQFVGSYKPVSDDDGRIHYEYVPGPFMRTLVAALKSGKTEAPKKYLLIVEEINRAKVAAVFGDMFQLLDRTDKGDSVYEIQASEDVRRYLADALDSGTKDDYKSIKIPNNMYIWATMNSADQGVFPMDTAFKRRWEFTYLGINEKEEEIKKTIKILPIIHNGNEGLDWNTLRKSINTLLLKECKVNEDKLLGPFFISGEVFKNVCKENLDKKNEDEQKKLIDAFFNAFNSKVLMYLFEDAGKMHQKKLFAGIDQNELTFSKVCEDFKTRGTAIFGNSFQLVKE